MMFTFNGQTIVQLPLDAEPIALPSRDLFSGDVFGQLPDGEKLGADYPSSPSSAFTSAGNNFELAIAVAIAVFGINSGVAFAAVVGPRIEVPALIALVLVAFWFERRVFA